MNVLNTRDPLTFMTSRQENMLGEGLEDLRDFAASMQRLRDALDILLEQGDENTERRVERMVRQLDGFEPSVTMIGQIKSGKTSLVNALIGVPDLLPADVNPWTSVVTSLHLNPETPDFENNASFRFFDEDEWDKLVSGGGRIGEMASRAGADEELEKIKAQVAQMREKSRKRLGRKFEVLLGQQRDYGYFDKDLIERYVCLGEEPEEGDDPASDSQGRFADITKSADLHLTRTAMPMRMCLRDTPGVNDTFMMREQITIRAIRDSRLCVVVLSAHQALSSTDMALIRLISNAKSRDVIIFVNRVDELSDPMHQVPQIRESIAETLRKHKGPQDAEVIFGSALWASYALGMRLDDLPPASATALQKWQHVSGNEAAPRAVDAAKAWRLSGIPALQKAMAERMVQGPGSALVQRIGASAKNLAAGLAAADRIATPDRADRRAVEISTASAHQKMQALAHDHLSKVKKDFDEILVNFDERLERVQDSFLDRATASLVDHLDQFGEQSPWTYDPAGLRVLLSSSHKVLARNATVAFEQATRTASDAIAEIYAQAFGLGTDEIGIALPRPPQVPAPVTLGRTIALDLSAGWWKRWWRQRRGYKAYASSFQDLIRSEIAPLIGELKDDLAQALRDEAVAAFEAFLSEQISVFETLANRKEASREEILALARTRSPRERHAQFQRTLETLNEYAAS
jgi:signal recognition particle receptor subunit beta/ElaB/YqjD/DUF883 family membrane-anchored ribosome-binding protein